MKRIITALLAIVMLFSIVACAKDSGKKNNGNSNNKVEGKIWDKHDLDFDGYEFYILSSQPSGALNTRTGEDIDVEELTGNEVLDQVYHRNRIVEATYNCQIRWANGADIKNTVLSGSDDDGSLIALHLQQCFKLVEDKLLLDLKDPSFSYLNLEKDWYNQTIQRSLELAGELYFVNGDMLFTDDNGMWVLMFNKELASRYVTDANLYDLVREGKWTLDNFMKYAALAATEVVADDKMDYQDQWGYVGTSPNVAAFVAGSGYLFANITSDGGIVTNVFKPGFLETFLKCNETVNKTFCLLDHEITGVENSTVTMFNIFKEGRALFIGTGMNNAITFREMEADFGLLPLPKYDEEQENYYTWTTYQTNVVSIPYYCSDPERTSAIMEALFEEGSYGIKPAYIDKALKYQTTRDDDSIEMLDIIMDSTVYDLGVLYDFGGIYSQLNSMVRARTLNTLSSVLAKAETPVNLAIDALIANLKK